MWDMQDWESIFKSLKWRVEIYFSQCDMGDHNSTWRCHAQSAKSMNIFLNTKNAPKMILGSSAWIQQELKAYRFG